MRPITVLLAAFMLMSLIVACGEDDNDILLATTTSTENSGLLDELLPAFEDETGYNVRVVAVGSGAALRMGEEGDADVLLAHAPDAEIEFVEADYGVDRTRVMYNDFILVGPPDDPAGVADAASAVEAFERIAEAEPPFASRADDSGTHQMELTFWDAAGIGDPSGESWYSETGQGMGETLTIAAEREGYTLTDRATWLETSDPDVLPLLFEGDDDLFNVYHVIVVNEELHDHDINTEGAQAFRAFLVEPETQELIGAYGVDRFGEALFVPYAE